VINAGGFVPNCQVQRRPSAGCPGSGDILRGGSAALPDKFKNPGHPGQGLETLWIAEQAGSTGG
jgi:hypothetical protein